MTVVQPTRVRLYGEMRGVTPVVRGRRWCRSVSVVVGGGERCGSNAGSCHLISWLSSNDSGRWWLKEVDTSRLLRWPSTRAQLKGLEIKKEILWEIKEAWMEEAAALRGRR
ncbi:hypothetical protein F2Q69_00031708 [Brassica cretica]|uniref:Uncharacterized protein n=1 Tax=Brassica cretica TaxID=69181 RepID=A0A8S9S4X9_BRACR|nr:hypothetical protein F2Q69_00031708 [Brassica cretica]